jgi:hypothetical protein
MHTRGSGRSHSAWPSRSVVVLRADRRGCVACAQVTGGDGACLRHWPALVRGLVWHAEPVKVAFDAELWLWDARRTQAWAFVSLPPSQSEEIRDLAGGLRRGFGSVRVRATIGNSTWATSIFPASQAGYVLPVKRTIRVAGALDVGDVAAVTVELIDFA